MNKQPEITGQTKANLLEAFWSLYSEKRIDQITVKEVAARAGYNRGTFYEYFNDVYQCLDHIERASLPRLDELPPLPTGQAPMPDFIASFIKLYQDKFRYYDVLLGSGGDPSFQRKLIDSIKATIAGAGQVPAGMDPLELDFMLEYMLSGMVGVMRYYFHAKPKESLTEMVAIMYRIMDGDHVSRLRQHLG